MRGVLVGGCEARLVLTGGEILDAGVQVFAQPPGKKNASIHLLSGGEKALTAIASTSPATRRSTSLAQARIPFRSPSAENFVASLSQLIFSSAACSAFGG